MIVEYAKHGNLKDFLKLKRSSPLNQGQGQGQHFDFFDLVLCALQVSAGLEFLASKMVGESRGGEGGREGRGKGKEKRRGRGGRGRRGGERVVVGENKKRGRSRKEET